MINKKILTGILILFSSFFILSCNIDDYEDSDLKGDEIVFSQYVQDNYKEIPSSVTSEINIVIYNNAGDEVATINGDSAEFVEEDAIIQNMSVLFQSHGENGIEYSTLVSDIGKINLGRKIEAWGNVIMVKEDEYRLETEKIIWEKSEQSMNKDGTDGRLTTEEGKLVTIYYADGTVIKGKNGYWEQGGNRIILEETYTEADQSTASNDSFLTGGTSTASSGTSTSSQKTSTSSSPSNPSKGDTVSTSRRTETEDIIKESVGITSSTKDENTKEKIISSVNNGREGKESDMKESTTRRDEENKVKSDTLRRPIVDDFYEQEMKEEKDSESSSNALNVISNITNNKDRRGETEYREINEEDIEKLIEMVKETEKLDKEEKMIIIEKLESGQMSMEEIMKLREKISE